MTTATKKKTNKKTAKKKTNKKAKTVKKTAKKKTNKKTAKKKTTKKKTSRRVAKADEPAQEKRKLSEAFAMHLRPVIADLFPDLSVSKAFATTLDKALSQITKALKDGNMKKEEGIDREAGARRLLSMLGEEPPKTKAALGKRVTEVLAEFKADKKKGKVVSEVKASGKLTITEPEPILLRYAEKEFKGKLLPNGKVNMDDCDGILSPSIAIRTLLQMDNLASWQLFLYEKAEGEWAPIDGLRTNPKGHKVFVPSERTYGPRRSKGERQVEKYSNLIARLEQKLTDARRKLADAEVLKQSEDLLKEEKWTKRAEKLNAMKADELIDLAAEKTGQTKATLKTWDWPKVIREVLLAEVQRSAKKALTESQAG